jgi:hypothetical protein
MKTIFIILSLIVLSSEAMAVFCCISAWRVLYWGGSGFLYEKEAKFAMEDQVEEYLEDEEEEYEEGAFRRWGLLIGIGIGVVCLGLIVVLWFGRDVFLTPVARLMASETPTSTNTLPPPTATFTAEPSETPTIAATLEPSPTLMRLPAMEIMALVSGPPVVSDPFDNNDLAWTGLGDNSEFTIQEGMMVVRSNQQGKPAMVYCSGNCGPFKDFYYFEAEMYDERASDFGFGLIFALNGQKNAYYAYKIRPATGEYGLFKFQNGNLLPLIDWTASPAVLPAPQPNVLGVSFLEKNIDLYLNGTRINNYNDRNPYNEGQVGFIADQDGVRLMINKATVYELIPRTPEAPQQFPTAAGATPIVATSTPLRYTLTPTAPGSCPRTVPSGSWALVVTAVGNNVKIEINGVVYELKELNTVFYLNLNTNYVVKTSNRTYEYFLTACKVIYIKAK